MRARGKEIYIITAVVAVVLIVAWYSCSSARRSAS